MSRFIQEPTLKVGSKAGKWLIDTPMRYYSTTLDEVVEAETGFLTDLASVPRISRILVPVNGKHRLPAIVHDKLYATRYPSRKVADLVFLEAMTVCGVPAWKRRVMYRAVRMFGQLAWEKKNDV